MIKSTSAFSRGLAARRSGLLITDNPFDHNHLKYLWDSGWLCEDRLLQTVIEARAEYQAGKYPPHYPVPAIRYQFITDGADWMFMHVNRMMREKTWRVYTHYKARSQERLQRSIVLYRSLNK